MEICFIQTGGTIDKDYPKLTKGYAFEITTPAVERILKTANPAFQSTIISLIQKDSQEITLEDRQLLLDTCLQSEANRIIITHGTDTLIETAQFLSSIKQKTIVLTGSMRPERFKDSDASFNIGVAIGAINVLSCGVFVAMHGRIYPANQVRRDVETGQFVEKPL